MRKLLKFLLVVFSVALMGSLVCISSLFIQMPWLTNQMQEWLRMYDVLYYVIAGISFFFILLVFILLMLLLMYFSRPDCLILKRATGDLEISRKSIINTARVSVQEIPEVSDVVVTVKKHPRPKKIKVKCLIRVPSSISYVEIADKAQYNIVSALNNSLEITPTAVKVRVYSMEENNRKKHTSSMVQTTPTLPKHEHTANDTRVL